MQSFDDFFVVSLDKLENSQVASDLRWLNARVISMYCLSMDE